VDPVEKEVVGEKGFPLRLPAKLYLLLKERARREGKSMNRVIVEALEKHLSTEADGNAKSTIEPFVKQPRTQPGIKEVEVEEHPCMGCPSFREADQYCYGLGRRVSSRECTELQRPVAGNNVDGLCRHVIAQKGSDVFCGKLDMWRPRNFCLNLCPYREVEG